MATSRITINQQALEQVARDSAQLQALTKRKAEQVCDVARDIFNASQRGDNELRTSETTPPKYVFSFQVVFVPTPVGWRWEARNDDPGAVFVEYGAHAGGETAVLRYRPLGRALDIVAALED